MPSDPSSIRCNDSRRVAATFATCAIHNRGPLHGKPAPLKSFQRSQLEGIYATDERGRRRYRTAFILGPKKVGKSWYFGNLGLFETTFMGQHGGDVYGIASSFRQGDELYKPAYETAKYSPAMQGLDLLIRPSTQEIRFPHFENRFAVLSTGQSGKGEELHGKAPRVLLVDELHAFKDRAAYDNVREGMAIWETIDPVNAHLTVMISNWGEIGSSRAFWSELEYAREVQKDPAFDPTWYVDIVEPPGGMRIEELLQSPRTWWDFHPGLQSGLITEQYLASRAKEALTKPSVRGRIARLHFCKPAPPETAFVDVERWDACSDPALNLGALAGRRAYLGIDMSLVSDLTAVTLIAPRDGAEEGAHPDLDWLSWSWIPEDLTERLEERTKMPLGAWLEDGTLEASPGDTVDDRVVRAKIGAIAQVCEVAQVAVDPKFCSRLARELMDDGLEVVSLSQGYRTFTEPLRSLEKAYLDRRLRHDGSPCLRWQAESLAVRTADDGSIRPAKIERERSTRRIDAIVAGAMAEWCRIHDETRVATQGGMWI